MSQPTYGYTFDKEGNIKNEKEYLSYSAIDLWRKDKEAYRRRYYEGEPSFTSPFTVLGTEVHRQVEHGELILNKHPVDKYKHEVKVEAELDGVLVLGYIDMLETKNNRVVDLKTSINPWDRVKVQQLKQLPLYQLLVRELYGRCSQYASVIWLETKWQEEEGTTIMCGDFELEQTTAPRQLVLTGKQVTIPRRIEQYERDNVREWVVKAAVEIAEDFKQWMLSPS